MFTILLSLLSVVVVFENASAAAAGKELHLPKDFPICARDDPDINACMKDLFQIVVPRIAKGLKELELPPIDPFEMQQLAIDYKNKEFNVQGKANAKDVQVHGLKNTEIRSVSVKLDDPENLSGELLAFVPELRVNGRYKLQGSFLNVPVQGKGKFEVLIGNITAFMTVEGKTFERNGKMFVDITKMDIDPVIGSLNIDAPTFFNGNRELSRTSLRMANQFWPMTYTYVKPFIQESIVDVVLPFINNYISRVPYDELVSPSAA